MTHYNKKKSTTIGNYVLISNELAQFRNKYCDNHQIYILRAGCINQMDFNYYFQVENSEHRRYSI